MKFTAHNYDDLRKSKRPCKLIKLVIDFKNSGLKCAKIEDWKYPSAYIGANVITASCKRQKVYPSIRAITRDNEIYLINDIKN